MNSEGPDAAVSVAGEFKVRLRTDTQETADAVLGDLVAVGWNHVRQGVHMHPPTLQYLVYNPAACDMAWFAGAEVIGVYRSDDAGPGPRGSEPGAASGAV
jgi:hypothetical protein